MRAVQCLAGSVGVTARDAPSGPSHILSFHLPAPATYNGLAHEPEGSTVLSLWVDSKGRGVMLCLLPSTVLCG